MDSVQFSQTVSIPSGWELTTFDVIADVIDPQPDHRTPPTVLDGEPYVGISDFISDGSIDFDSCRRVSTEVVNKQQQSFRLEPGDIVFGKIGTIGLPRFLPTVDHRYALSANVVLIKPKGIPGFVLNWLQSDFVNRQINQQLHTTSQPAFGIQRIRALHILLPPLAEQRRIAEILGAWDEAIALTGRLIDALKRRKQGLMQRLLTGRVRFKEFVGSNYWQKTKNSEIPEDWKWERLEGYLTQQQRWITLEDDMQYRRCTVKLHNQGITFRDLVYGREVRTKRQQVVSEGDLLVAEIDAKMGGFGIVKSDAAGSIVSGHYFAFEIGDGLLIDFLEQCLFQGMLERQVDAVGSTNYAAIRPSSVMQYRIPVPSIQEQRAIADVLGAQDRELKLFSELLARLQNQKSGLVQRLLTGQIRVGV